LLNQAKKRLHKQWEWAHTMITVFFRSRNSE
jgi:hypothetical protein